MSEEPLLSRLAARARAFILREKPYENLTPT
jgi:hypothetical protein